jgi:Tfp pilus assembly PilM family ATPase
VGSSCFFTRPLASVWDEEDAGSRLADEIRLSIDYYMTQPQAKPVGEVVLAGPGSSDAQLVESIETHLGISVIVPGPLGVIDGSALGPNEDPHRYTVAAGLSLGAAA